MHSWAPQHLATFRLSSFRSSLLAATVSFAQGIKQLWLYRYSVDLYRLPHLTAGPIEMIDSVLYGHFDFVQIRFKSW